jgi:hypothetical protein
MIFIQLIQALKSSLVPISISTFDINMSTNFDTSFSSNYGSPSEANGFEIVSPTDG